MESLYDITAILSAGISLTIGALSIFKSFHKGAEKVHLVFGTLCLLVAIFILLPPLGFIFNDSSPSPTSVKVKRIFHFAFMALLPWFIALYTGNKKRIIPLTVTASIIICYLVMFISNPGSSGKLWALMAIIILGIIMIHGSYAGYHQFKNGKKAKAIWLFAATGSFILLNIPGAFKQFEIYPTRDWDAIFIAINLCPLAFILIMGFQLQSNSNKQSRLEKVLALRDSWWQSLLENIHLIVVKTDMEGRIRYINPYGTSLLGYKDAKELVDTNWSDHCLSALEAHRSKTVLGCQAPAGDAVTPTRSLVVTKDGKEKTINWNYNLIYNDDGDPIGRMNIGANITEHKEAIQQIKELKAELEKENLAPARDGAPSGMHQEVIGKSRPFTYAIQKSKQVAPTNASVLLLGETGVGKEAFADLIQATSLRCKMPFVKVNCGALPAELIEDELFGHEKGAFTGAIQTRIGRFEKANGGTIFLDEIGELPLVLQPKLLRVLQNGEFERVGGHHTVKVDVRVIAATNSDLEKEVRENRFRDDLFYRLNVFPITIPPLRKRNEDIGLLIQYFIEKKSREHDKHFENISKADMTRLCEYEWPGNIRELKNVIERAVISSENNTLKLDSFYQEIENRTQSGPTASLEEMETAYILKVLQECRWKINGENGAAEKLVMHPNTLRSRMKKLNISMPWKQEELS